MKLVIRADDFGYTEEFNRGTIEAIKHGIVTTVDMMLDTPGTLDAMERIKEYPWVSVGWHGGHCWGRPVAEASKVSSLLDSEGRFKYWNDASKKNDVLFDEALIECRAEIKRCINVLGKAPICTDVHPEDSIYEKARSQACDEYGIKYSYMYKKNRKTQIMHCPSAEYKDLEIYMPIQHESVYKCLYSDNPDERMQYNPVRYFIDDTDHLLEKKTVITAWHPGYLDDYICSMFPMNHFHLARVMDITALCSQQLKQWICDKHIELINMNDALLQTQQYQNHLNSIEGESR